jgi:hypothetical protein
MHAPAMEHRQHAAAVQQAIRERAKGRRVALLVLQPPELSANVAEWALPEADAVVSVSSSMAGQALISGKQVVVVGRTPLRALAHTSLAALAEPRPSLTRLQRAALLAFLSHSYTLTRTEIGDPEGSFPDHLRTLATSPDPISWLLDLSHWAPERLARLL